MPVCKFPANVVWLHPWNIVTRDIPLGAPCVLTSLPAWQPYLLLQQHLPQIGNCTPRMQLLLGYTEGQPEQGWGIWDLSSIQLVVTHRKKQTQVVISDYSAALSFCSLPAATGGTLNWHCCTVEFPTLKLQGGGKRKGHVNKQQLSMKSYDSPLKCKQPESLKRLPAISRVSYST